MAELIALLHTYLCNLCAGGLMFKFKVFTYPSIKCSVTHNDVVFISSGNPLKPQRPHNTNKLENMCHAAPAYNF